MSIKLTHGDQPRTGVRTQRTDMATIKNWWNKYWGIAIISTGVLAICTILVDCANGISYEEDVKAVGQVFVQAHTECATTTSSSGSHKVDCNTHPAHWRITVELPNGELKDIKSQHGVPTGRQVVITYREGKYSHFRYGESIK